jgi:hypothetical protein
MDKKILTTHTVGRALKEASLPVEGVRVDSSAEQGAEEKGGE